MAAFDLEQYLAQGVRHILTGLTAAAGKNIKTAAFLARFAMAAQSAKHRRAQLAAAGEHIPPFLIASITEQCNLHCRGCYARAGGVCCDGGADDVLTAAQWADLFTQAVELGVSFILLAGGEPLLRPDVLAVAAREKRIIFPVFTNGTLFSPDACALFLQNRNLMPVLSLEGDAAATDARRGSGVYHRLQDAMALLHKNGVLFGASITVTRKNLTAILAEDFLRALHAAGCRAVIYVEYVPVTQESEPLALTDADRATLEARLTQLRAAQRELLLVSFPGDEKSSGGCLAAGRGFFHINPRGGAEPCPFSPYSDTNLTLVPLRQALRSPLFRRLQEQGYLTQAHTGGCVLFPHADEVAALAQGREICRE